MKQEAAKRGKSLEVIESFAGYCQFDLADGGLVTNSVIWWFWWKSCGYPGRWNEKSIT
jgi:hypothetical protein